MQYRYFGPSADSTYEDILELRESAQPVTWKTFRKHTPGARILLESLGVVESGTTNGQIEELDSVGFYKGIHRGLVAYFIVVGEYAWIWEGWFAGSRPLARAKLVQNPGDMTPKQSFAYNMGIAWSTSPLPLEVLLPAACQSVRGLDKKFFTEGYLAARQGQVMEPEPEPEPEPEAASEKKTWNVSIKTGGQEKYIGKVNATLDEVKEVYPHSVITGNHVVLFSVPARQGQVMEPEPEPAAKRLPA